MALHRYSFRVFLAFLLGIAVHSAWSEFRFPEWIWVVAAVCIVCVCSVRTASVRFGTVLFIAFVFGAWRFDLTVPRSVDGLLPHLGDSVSISGVVLETGRSAQSPDFVRVSSVDGKRVSGAGSVVAIRLPETVNAAERVRAVCTLKELSPKTWGRASYLRRGAWTSCSGVTSLEFESAPTWDPLAMLTAWRLQLTSRIHRRFTSENAGLLAGILYGDEDLSTERRNAFRDSGLIHLIAVSGSNVTLVIASLMPIAFFFHATRRKAFLFASIGLLAFLGFVGMSAAVVRAGIMGWLALLAREFGRLPRPEHLLLCAATVLCLINPRTLAFDVGFHLSILATWSLLAWSGRIETRLTFVPKFFGIRSALATSLAVTAALFPYAIWMFGTYSVAGIFTNIVALPLIPWIMLFGSVAVVLPESVATVVSVPATGLLDLLQSLASIGAELPRLESASRGSVPLLLATYLLIYFADSHFRYPQSTNFLSRFFSFVGDLRQRIAMKNVEPVERLEDELSELSVTSDKIR